MKEVYNIAVYIVVLYRVSYCTYNIYTILQILMLFSNLLLAHQMLLGLGSIIVTFDTSDEGEAISANTCGKQLCLSTKICEEEVFIAAMQAIIEEVTFTMP